MLLFENNRLAPVYFDGREPNCVHLALGDLKEDLKKVTGMKPELHPFLPVEEKGYVVIGSLENPRFRAWLAGMGIAFDAIEGKWEHFSIVSFGPQNENLCITDSDCRGTVFGAYHFCETFLEVDPLYFWTDNEPKRKEKINPGSVHIVDGPETSRFRGWFLNDEDLLTQWKNGGGKRFIDYPYYHQVTHHTIIEKVAETALRLKQNLLIPASFVDIMNPPEENLVRIVTERGLFISQHHVEPMGVSHFAWDNYWKEKGMSPPASFVAHPELFSQIWTDYAQKWGQYPNVIWQLGLRGRGDRPVWVHDPNVPSSMEERGGLISRAMSVQAEIVERVLGHKDFYSTTTLWMEGGELHNKGFLIFPKNTAVVFADEGPTQMWGEDFHHVVRREDTRYGVYYHVAFWGAGPRLAQITSPQKIEHNYRLARERGDTYYSIVNVGNIREFVLGIKALAEITWNIETYNRDNFMKSWCLREFGQDLTPQYHSFYSAFHVLKKDTLPDEQVLMDGVARMKGLALLDVLGGGEPGKWSGHSTKEEMLSSLRSIFPEATRRWKEVFILLASRLSEIRKDRQPFFRDHFLVQAQIMLGLYGWVEQLFLAAEGRGLEALSEAVFYLEKALLDRTAAEHGKWENWYRGDKKMNLPDLLEKTKALLKDYEKEAL